MLDKTVQFTGSVIEIFGIIVIVAGAFYVIIRLISLTFKRNQTDVFNTLRKDLGRAILLGLEFLVAGDIIRTVVIKPSFVSVGILAIVVVIRTFLSFSLEIEMNGKLPWKKGSE